MARLTAKERREKAVALAAAVEESRRVWLGKKVQFVADLDEKVKQGRVVEVTDDRWVHVEYAPWPWCDDLDGSLGIFTGHEAEILTMVEEE